MNWTHLLTDLSSAGLSQTRIAEICESSQATISDLKTGRVKDPSFCLGSALVELHRRVMQHGASAVIDRIEAAHQPVKAAA